MARIDYAALARELAARVPPEGWQADSLHRVHGLAVPDIARRLRIQPGRCEDLLALAAAAYEATTEYLSARAGHDDGRKRNEGPDEIVEASSPTSRARMRRLEVSLEPAPPRRKKRTRPRST